MPQPKTLVGQTLNGRYEVTEKIGEGGFGSVYRATQVQMGRQVALKVLNPAMSQDPQLVARFKREAQSACNLRDPHTIITYDFDHTEDGTLYMAMELLQGHSLLDAMKDGPVPPDRVLRIVEQMCTSLGEAHSLGIVHRDIKPENVYLEERPGQKDYVKILDFGIAKIISGDGEQRQGPQLTATGQTLGTLEYMSPEQLMGKQLDGRSDLYAVGVVMYEMLTGRLPFDTSSPGALITAQLRETPKPPSQNGSPNSPPELDALIARTLEKDREKRWRDAAEMREASLAIVQAMAGPRTQTPYAGVPAMPIASGASAGYPAMATGAQPVSPAGQAIAPGMTPGMAPGAPPPMGMGPPTPMGMVPPGPMGQPMGMQQGAWGQPGLPQPPAAPGSRKTVLIIVGLLVFLTLAAIVAVQVMHKGRHAGLDRPGGGALAASAPRGPIDYIPADMNVVVAGDLRTLLASPLYRALSAQSGGLATSMTQLEALAGQPLSRVDQFAWGARLDDRGLQALLSGEGLGPAPPEVLVLDDGAQTVPTTTVAPAPPGWQRQSVGDGLWVSASPEAGSADWQAMIAQPSTSMSEAAHSTLAEVGVGQVTQRPSLVVWARLPDSAQPLLSQALDESHGGGGAASTAQPLGPIAPVADDVALAVDVRRGLDIKLVLHCRSADLATMTATSLQRQLADVAGSPLLETFGAAPLAAHATVSTEGSYAVLHTELSSTETEALIETVSGMVAGLADLSNTTPPSAITR
jgi:serine/threonine-protein kinase